MDRLSKTDNGKSITSQVKHFAYAAPPYLALSFQTLFNQHRQQIGCGVHDWPREPIANEFAKLALGKIEPVGYQKTQADDLC